MIKAALKPIISVKYPYKGGISAPPTIAVHNKPDALGFNSPIPSIAKVKIVGNMMELNKPTAKILHILNKPVVLIEMRINIMATLANIPSTFPGFIIRVKYEPTKRPIIAPDQ